MTTASETAELVTLRSGRVLPLAVIVRSLELEERGVRLWRDAENYLRATPGDLLTAEDRSFLKANRDAFLVAVQEVAEAVCN